MHPLVMRMPSSRAWLVSLASAFAALTLIAAPAAAATPAELEACFLDEINDARASAGAPTLGIDQALSAYGRDHSEEMADTGSLYHSSQADLDPHLPPGWRAWGENVGYATGSDDCLWLFEGFWESPEHRDNLLNPIFDSVGIGVYVDGTDTMWTTHVFVQNESPPPTTTTTTSSTTTTTVPTTTTSTTATTSTTTPTSPTTAPGETTTTTAAHETTVPGPTSTVTFDAQGGAGAVVEVGGTDEPAPGLPVEPSGDPSTVIVAGDETGCDFDCSPRLVYLGFLALVALSGGALSWWAFRG